jgi:hypothetical protein
MEMDDLLMGKKANAKDIAICCNPSAPKQNQRQTKESEDNMPEA